MSDYMKGQRIYRPTFPVFSIFSTTTTTTTKRGWGGGVFVVSVLLWDRSRNLQKGGHTIVKK